MRWGDCRYLRDSLAPMRSWGAAWARRTRQFFTLSLVYVAQANAQSTTGVVRAAFLERSIIDVRSKGLDSAVSFGSMQLQSDGQALLLLTSQQNERALLWAPTTGELRELSVSAALRKLVPSITVAPNGTYVMTDQERNEAILLGSDGVELRRIRFSRQVSGSAQMSIRGTDSALVVLRDWNGPAEPRFAEWWSLDGRRLHVVPLPAAGRAKPAVYFGAYPFTQIAPDGSVLSGHQDAYRIVRSRPEQSDDLLQRRVPAVPLQGRESAAWTIHARTIAAERRVPAHIPLLGNPKPPVRDVLADESGTVWVVRSAIGVLVDDSLLLGASARTTPRWREPLVIDAWSVAGCLRGTVHIAVGRTLLAVAHGQLWVRVPSPAPMLVIERYKAPIFESCTNDRSEEP